MMITVIAIVIVIVTIITVVARDCLNLQCLPKAHLQEQPEVAIWPPKFSGTVDFYS
jgi:hypothetical protein